MTAPASDRGASRPSAAGRRAARGAGRTGLAARPSPVARVRRGVCAGPPGAMTAAVGASHRLPCAARPGVVRRNSLRSLRELRSNTAPQVRSTKRASRADPGAALLGAAEIAPRGPAHTPRLTRATGLGRAASPVRPAPRAARRPAADGRSNDVGGVRSVDGAIAPEPHDGIGKGAGRAPWARLVRSREAQQHRRRAQRASSIILAAIVRAELAQRAQRVSPRQPVLRASQGTPAKRGQAPGAPTAPGPRLCSRQRPESQNAPCALEPLT